MRIFSYRNKRNFRIALLIALAAVVLLALLVVCRFVYLERFIVYDQAGARLDYTQALSPSGMQPAPEQAEAYPFRVVIDETAPVQEQQPVSLQQLSGYYITTNMLAADVKAVREELQNIPDLTAVMIDVKSIFGNFYYRSDLADAQLATVDIDAVEALIRELDARKDLWLIARFPAFCDPNFALAHQSQALPLYSGALWTDSNDCYWLNPYSSAVQGYITSIVMELEGLGFDEVVLDGFLFPDSDRIAWTSQSVSRQDALEDAASYIRTNLAGSSVKLGLCTAEPSLAAYADRLYITPEEPSMAAQLCSSLQDSLPDTAAQIVFLTDSRDTRYTICGVLRPLMD